MKLNLRHIILPAALTFAAATMSAQHTYSGYFLDSYTPRYQMNPAFSGPSNAFVGFPVLSDLNIAMRGNLHVSDILYPNPGEGKRTVLFTNPLISTEEAMSRFSNMNKLGTSLKLDLINFGFKAFGGYNTVGINAVADVNVGVPKSLFSLAKEGVSNSTYDIQDFRAQASAYAEVALNHSREIKQVPGLRVGATLKFLVGMGNVDAYFNNASLTLGENNWHAVTNANIYASVKGLRYKTKINEDTRHEYVSGMDLDGYGPNGFGIGFDLGATYKWREFTFSLALLDLGFISWGHTQYASTDGDQEFNTDAFAFAVKDDDTFDRMKDDLSALYELNDHGNIGSRTRALKATLNWGVEYEFPLYKPLHFGLLNSTRFAGPFTWTQFRLSANVKPCKVFSANANLAMGTYGVGFGWLLNLHAPGFNLFLGMDRTLGKLAKQGVPLNSNAEVNFGINFPF